MDLPFQEAALIWERYVRVVEAAEAASSSRSRLGAIRKRNSENTKVFGPVLAV